MKHDVNQVTERLDSVEPATAVVSLINPEDISSVRSFFCNQVHFLASPEEDTTLQLRTPRPDRKTGLIHGL